MRMLRLVMQRLGPAEHKLPIRRDSDLGVAQVRVARCDQRRRFPFLAIDRSDNAQGTIGRHMPLAFTKDTEPAVVEPYKIREGVVRCLIPNLLGGSNRHGLLRHGLATIRTPQGRKSQQQKNAFHQ